MTDKNKQEAMSDIKKRLSDAFASFRETLSPTADKKPDKAAIARLLRAAITYFLKKGAIVLISYLFGSAAGVFDTYPFGLALLCSASRDIVFIYAGLIVSSLTQHTQEVPAEMTRVMAFCRV